MIWIVIKKLREQRPLVYYILAGILFILAQLTYFLLSRPICNGTNAKIDGSFIATALETAAVIVLYLAWQNITEGSSISRRVCKPFCSLTVRWQTTGARMYTTNEWRGLFYYVCYVTISVMIFPLALGVRLLGWTTILSVCLQSFAWFHSVLSSFTHTRK